MTEEPLNLRRLLGVLARGTWIIVTCTLLGVAAVVGVRFAHPPLSFTARAKDLLPTAPVSAAGQPAADAADTEVQIAQSQQVLDAASRILHPKPTAADSADLKSRLKVSAVTAQVLEFTVRGASAREAIAETNAVADAYLQLRNQAKGAVQKQPALQVTLLDRATDASNDAVRSASLAVGIGAIGGLLLGCTIVLAHDARNRKLRRRDDIAVAAGAPAVASIATRHPRNREAWRALFARYEADPDEQLSLRRVIRTVLASSLGSPARLTIVTLSRDDAAVAIAPQFAACAAGAGVSTLLVVPAGDTSVASLHQACKITEPGRANLATLGTMHSDEIEQTSAQLIVMLAVVEDDALDIVAGDPSITLFGISAGAADPERIAAVAASAADAGHPLAGVIIANADARDDTSGRVRQDQPVSRRQRLPNKRPPRAQPGSA